MLQSKNSIILLLGVLAVGLFFGYGKYKEYFAANVPSSLNDDMLLIPTGSTYEDVVKILQDRGFVEDIYSFKSTAEKMQYDKSSRIKAGGRFKLQPGWSNRDLIKHLRLGEQEPVKVVFNYERMTENIAAKAAKTIEADSITIYQKMNDPAFLDKLGYKPEELMCIFLPNTYNMFWNIGAEKFLERMKKESDDFWNKNNRREKAKALNMTPEQVYTLASIVEKESLNEEERPRIAGAYLNRLKTDMKLQADPTCVFATKDFSTHRVTLYHTNFDSPYNTYMYKGLPPGPISIASASSIDAVLNYEKHNYIYFCAKVDDSGTHAFAETFAQHNVNVAKYKEWLRTKGY
jgi:UPF0755 protein